MVKRLKVSFCLIVLVLLLPAVVFAAQGELDPTFNGTGFAINVNPSGGGEPAMVAVQKDGKSVVATTYRPEETWVAHFMLLRYNMNGTLDSTFNGTGVVKYDADYAFATDVAIQKDGKIVVAGMRLNDGGTAYDLMLLRYNTNGSLDTGFGTNGVVIYLSDQWYNYRLTLNKLAIQEDGKIVVAGYTSNPDASSDMLLLRYNTNGTLDTGFGTNGVVTYDSYLYDDTVADPEVHLDYPDLDARKVKIMPDGNIAVLIQAGACFFVAKYSATNGALLSETKPFFGGIDVPGYGMGATAQSMDIQKDGKIVVTGEVGQIVVLRYGTDGNFDRTFGTSDPKGANYFDLVEFFDYDEQGGGFSAVFDVVIQPDGKILVAGHCPIDHDGDGFPEEMDLLVLRYTSAGAYDTPFGSGGAFVFDDGWRGGWPEEGDRGMSIAIQPDGYIMVAGTLIQGDTTDDHYDTLLMRIKGEPLPDIDVTPALYDFGEVAVGGTATGQITISNKGKLNLSVTGIQMFGGDATLFTPSKGTCPSLTPTLTPGSSCTLSVQFSSDSEGLKTTTLRISSNDPFDPWKDEVPWDVPLRGTGVTPQADYTLTVNTEGSGLGNVRSTSSGINCGNGGADCTETFTAGQRVTLVAKADTAGSVFAGWSGACTGKDKCVVRMDTSRNVTATFTKDPTLSVTPGSKTFPKTKGGQLKKALFTVKNKVTNGKADLVIGDISMTGDTDHFRIDQDRCSDVTLKKNKECTYKLVFEPQATGQFSVIVAIPSNDPASPKQVIASGTGWTP